jgi:hypothetical protein
MELALLAKESLGRGLDPPLTLLEWPRVLQNLQVILQQAVAGARVSLVAAVFFKIEVFGSQKEGKTKNLHSQTFQKGKWHKL